MTLISVCEIRKSKRNVSHKILTGVKLFLSVLFKYIPNVGEYGRERSANTADEDF